MNDNVKKLEEIKDRLQQIERFDPDLLKHEPTIAKPLHEAAVEAEKRYRQVAELPKP